MNVDDLVRECNGAFRERRELNLSHSIFYCSFLPKPDCPYIMNGRVRVPEAHEGGVVKVKYYLCKAERGKNG